MINDLVISHVLAEKFFNKLESAHKWKGQYKLITYKARLKCFENSIFSGDSEQKPSKTFSELKTIQNYSKNLYLILVKCCNLRLRY